MTTTPRNTHLLTEQTTSPDTAARRVPAVSRAVAILRLLGKAERPLGVNQIARALGLVPSTCLHILRVLVEEELVAFDPVTKHYSLDAGVLTLARNVMRRNSFTDVVQPSLDQLSERFATTAIGVQVVGLKHMVVVAISRTEQPFRLHVDVGSRFPALISATGRCYAAFGGHPWDDLKPQFKALRWDQPPSLETWRADVLRTRECGYSVDWGTYIKGVTVVSVPVLDARGHMSHAIVAVGLGERIKEDTVESMVEEMRKVAASVSERLGGRADPARFSELGSR